MMIIKNNQALEIKIETDDIGYSLFNDFTANEGIGRIDDATFICIKEPDEKRFKPDDLTSIKAAISALEALDHAIVDSMDLNYEESEELMQAMLNDTAFDIDVARRGLLSLTFSDWFDGLLYKPGSRDWHDAMADLQNTIYSDCGERVAFYLQGVSSEIEKMAIIKEFKMYAFATPLSYAISLIDCKSGDVISTNIVGGIYDDSYTLDYLSGRIIESLNEIPDLNEELRNEVMNKLKSISKASINR
jgi:hypothetical protein